MAKQDDFTRLQVRLPKELHESLVEAAAKTGRSMNSEIVERLYVSGSSLEDFRQSLRDTIEKNIETDLINGDLRRMDEYKKALKDVLRLVISLLKKPDRTNQDERDALISLVELLADLSD